MITAALLVALVECHSLKAQQLVEQAPSGIGDGTFSHTLRYLEERQIEHNKVTEFLFSVMDRETYREILDLHFEGQATIPLESGPRVEQWVKCNRIYNQVNKGTFGNE